MGNPARFTAQTMQRSRDFIRAQNEDRARAEFLRALDDDEEINLTDFETQFVGSFVAANGPEVSENDPGWFTPGRRRVTDAMIKRYGARRQPARVTDWTPPPTQPGTCGYRVTRDEQRNQPCGEPAVIKLASGLELCGAHDQARREGIERLRRFKARHP